jgi:UDPglucose 6-dehydrogenase
VNLRQKQLLGQMVLAQLGDDLSGKTVALWGLAFKPKTDDVREAPAKIIADILIRAGARLRLHDPEARETFQVSRPPSEQVTYCERNYDAAEGAHALCLVTEWPVYRSPDFRRLKQLMARPVLFDGRNLWDSDYVRGLGFSYHSIGRP